MSMRKYKTRVQTLLGPYGNFVNDQQQIITQPIDYYYHLFNGQIGGFFPTIQLRKLMMRGKDTYLLQYLYLRLKKLFSPLKIPGAR